MTRDEWLREIREHGTPKSEAGAWIRMNPTDGRGIADANVSVFRFALVEFDAMPLDLQLSLLTRLPLPINAIVTSGGKSLHAWIRVNARSADAYRETAGRMLGLLARFGVDTANKNPSRMTRLPGAQRIIGAMGDGLQRILYLSPDNTSAKPIL
jgi:hypothetical protein